MNQSNGKILEEETDLFTSQDKELLSVVRSVQNMNDSLNSKHKVSVISEVRLTGYFCSETVFNLSGKILTDTKTKIFEKSFDSAPVKRKINEVELRSYFEGFCRRVRTNWDFRNESTPDFSNVCQV